jgi:predicted PurR-regulated permease PerM
MMTTPSEEDVITRLESLGQEQLRLVKRLAEKDREERRSGEAARIQSQPARTNDAAMLGTVIVGIIGAVVAVSIAAIIAAVAAIAAVMPPVGAIIAAIIAVIAAIVAIISATFAWLVWHWHHS